MLKLFIALQLAVLTVRDALEDRARSQRDERGSVTIQEVLWIRGSRTESRLIRMLLRRVESPIVV